MGFLLVIIGLVLVFQGNHNGFWLIIIGAVID